MLSLSAQFEYEKLARLIDDCEDIESLKEKCKELLHLHLVQKQTTATLLYHK